jgi:ABC-2 type transport system ATP-binding protein
MIEVADLMFDYPTKRALEGVSFTVPAQAVVALVGPNGAGKTTLLRCIAALDAPLSGSVRVDGVSAEEDPRGVHRRIGYLSDFFGLYDELSVLLALRYAARSRGLSGADADAAAVASAERVGLADRLHEKAGSLSRGLRQRLGVAMCIVHRPKVLLLDEPAAGLDPEARRSLSDLILALRDEGVTLIVSSHILSELEDYCDRMIAIEGGRIAGGGPIARDAATRARIRITFAAPIVGVEALFARLGAEIEARDGDTYVVTAPSGGAEAEAAMLRALVEAGAPVSAFAARKRTLEEAYFEDALGRPLLRGAAS